MAHNNLANELMNAGELEAAKEQFLEAARLGKDATDWVGLGQISAIKGDYQGALQMYLKALDQTPISTEPVLRRLRAGREFQLGVAYQGLAGEFPRQAGEYFSKAEEAYRSAIDLDPEYEDPRTNMASILVTQGRYSEAIAQCKAVLEENPESFSAHMNMGNAFYSQGQLELARAEYQSALQILPENTNAMASIGAILAQEGHLAEGIAMLRDALKIDPNNALAQRNLLAALSKQAQSAR
jgi:tetratricopeptide (TPR) repeat protein